LKREIGSEFWYVPTCEKQNTVFPENTKWFLSGRSALKAIITENNFKSVSLPSWCCESMITPFVEAGIETKFYPVYGTEQTLSGVTTDALLIMDYFGYTGYSKVPKGYGGVVIRDVTHSIFSSIYNDADYYFGSLRKWAGFWTGGFAWGLKTNVSVVNKNYADLREQAMKLKEGYINEVSESKEYLKIFNKAEDLLEKCSMVAAEERDIELAKKLNVELIKNRRRANAKILLNTFADVAFFPEFVDIDCPMFVPIRVKDRCELRRHLIQNEIYCPVHWPVSEYHKLDNKTEKLYTEELSLVCDQRYTEEDMERVVKIVEEYWKE